MLETILNIVNFFTIIFYYFYAGSYFAGKFICLSLGAILKFIYYSSLSLGNLLTYVTDELFLFTDAIKNNALAVFIFVCEALLQSVESIKRILELICNETVRFFLTGKIKATNLLEALKIGLYCLVQNIFGAMITLGNVVWFILTLLPWCILQIILLLRNTIIFIFDYFINMCKSATEELIDLGFRIMDHLKNTPPEALGGLLLLFAMICYSRRTYTFFRMNLQFLVLLIVTAAYGILRLIHIIVNFLNLRRRIIPENAHPNLRSSSVYTNSYTTSRQDNQSPSERTRHASRSSSRISGRKSYQNESQMCIICQERPKTVVFFPCRHLCSCDHCSYSLMGYQGTCPLCRHLIENYVAVYT